MFSHTKANRTALQLSLKRRKAELGKHALKSTIFSPASWIYQCNHTWNVLSGNWLDFQEVMNNKALKELGCCKFSEHTSGPALTTNTFGTNYLKSGTRQICQSLQLPAGPHNLRWCSQICGSVTSSPALAEPAPHVRILKGNSLLVQL